MRPHFVTGLAALAAITAACSNAVKTIHGTRPTQSRDAAAEFLGATHFRNGGAAAQSASQPKGVSIESLLDDSACKAKGPAPAPRALRLLTPVEYEKTLQDLLGDSAFKPRKALPAGELANGFDNNIYFLAGNASMVDAARDNAEGVALYVQANAARLAPCAANATTATGAACVESTLAALGKRAYRRPLTQTEVKQYLDAVYAPTLAKSDFATAFRYVVEAVFQSPHFLYRSELGVADGSGGFRLTSHEAATYLSYFITGTTPSDALLAAADAKQLSTPEQIRTAAEALLATPGADFFKRRFVRSWLGLQDAAKTKPGNFPNWSVSLASDLISESELFFAAAIDDPEANFAQLFGSPKSFLTDLVAAHYDMPSPGSRTPTAATVANPKHAYGLLGQGAFLAAHGGGPKTNPFARGKYVRSQILCVPLKFPDPGDFEGGIPKITQVAGLTTRERFEQHSSDPRCASCHRLIDGIGFSMENYDSIGKSRTMEEGKAVRTDGTVYAIDGKDVKINSGAELSRMLRESRQARSCMVLMMSRYASGRTEKEAEVCSVAYHARRFEESSGNLRGLVLDLASSPWFFNRR